MKYKGYEVTEYDSTVCISNVRDFEPEHIFDCGQSFRWKRQDDDSYTGIAYGKVINVSKNGNDIFIKNANLNDFKDIWFDYFDLGRDYGELKEKVCKDNNMNEAIKFGHGIRLLVQDFHEMLISFIISANNRIPMIMRSVDLLSQEYGSKLDYNGQKLYTFPRIKSLAESSTEMISNARVGFRAKYIHETSKKVMTTNIQKNFLKEMETQDARNCLTQLNGVGYKVADCVLLFSGIKGDVFPTDVWVKRVMEELYLKRDCKPNYITEYARDYFGEDCGLAQQYLFYYARQNKIGMAKN